MTTHSTELESINHTETPITRYDFVEDILKFDFNKDDFIFVQCSLSRLGWFSGGISGVYAAIIDILGDNRTILMPTFTSDLSSPDNWENPPVPKRWFSAIRDSIVPYESYQMPRGMSKLYTQLLLDRRSHRSMHPHNSFASIGTHAEALTSNHSMDMSLGNNSPLGRFYGRNGYSLMIGTDFSTYTPFHLAQYRCAIEPLKIQYPSAIVDGFTQWSSYEDISLPTDDFGHIGLLLDVETKHVRSSAKYNVKCVNFDKSVDFATNWLSSQIKPDGMPTKR